MIEFNVILIFGGVNQQVNQRWAAVDFVGWLAWETILLRRRRLLVCIQCLFYCILINSHPLAFAVPVSHKVYLWFASYRSSVVVFSCKIWMRVFWAHHIV